MPKTPEENFIDWEGHVFGFGYGTGEPHVIPALKRFFELCREDGGYDYKALEDGLTPVVAWLFINVLAGRNVDVLEYGTSPRYAWLTEQGKKLQMFLRSRTADDLIELVTGYDENYTHCYPDACNCGPEGYEKGRGCHNPFWKSRPKLGTR